MTERVDETPIMTIEQERLTPTQEELRPEVLAFALLMERQLRANDHKPGWKGDCSTDLLDRLVDETEELVAANERHAKRQFWGDGWQMEDTSAQVGKEAADVANFAMMIADVCGALPALKSPPIAGEEGEPQANLAWKQYAADFRAMSDEEIEDETSVCRDQVDEAESWLEAVASWEAAGKPRGEDADND